MDNHTHIRFNAEDRSYFAILKKEIHNIGLTAGFSDRKIGEIDIIVAEMASNLVKYAGGGELLVALFNDGRDEGIEIMSIDNGPGMHEPMKMVADGLSTSNTLGHGLGSIKRLSDTFDIYSLKDWGTIVLSRVFKNEPRYFKHRPAAEIRSLIVAKPGEKICGDGAWYSLDENKLQLFLGDGLGHGPEANKAVQEAIRVIKEYERENIEPSEMLRILHKETKRTRGLVGTIANYSFQKKEWSICGIGNIATRTYNGPSLKNYLSYNGIIGHNIPNTIKEQGGEAENGQSIIMCSDGIKTRWELQKYIGIFKCDLSILAAVIYKDYARRTDDMSVVVGRINAKL